MSIHVYLNFNGNCREAVEYYSRVFETEIEQIMTFGDMPEDPSHPLTEEMKNLVLHAQLPIHGGTVMFSDILPGMPFHPGNNVSLTIVSNNLEEVHSLFDKLKEGGSVLMELQETFWSKCYGIVKDRFGIEWQLNYESTI